MTDPSPMFALNAFNSLVIRDYGYRYPFIELIMDDVSHDHRWLKFRFFIADHEHYRQIGFSLPDLPDGWEHFDEIISEDVDTLIVSVSAPPNWRPLEIE